MTRELEEAFEAAAPVRVRFWTCPIAGHRTVEWDADRARCTTAGCGRTSRPRRVKVAGDLFHGVVPAGAVYVGRAMPGLKRTPWANPYPVKQHGRAESLRLYRAWMAGRTPGQAATDRRFLAGRDLACWCPLDPEPGWIGPWCHADILLELLAQPA